MQDKPLTANESEFLKIVVEKGRQKEEAEGECFKSVPLIGSELGAALGRFHAAALSREIGPLYIALTDLGGECLAAVNALEKDITFRHKGALEDGESLTPKKEDEDEHG